MHCIGVGLSTGEFQLFMHCMGEGLPTGEFQLFMHSIWEGLDSSTLWEGGAANWWDSIPIHGLIQRNF